MDETAEKNMPLRTMDHATPVLPELSLLALPAYNTLWPCVKEIANDLRQSKLNETTWNAIDRGILLLGDKSDWKKFVAKSLATSLGVDFYQATVSEWLSTSNRAEGILDMRSNFHALQGAKESILFIDDLDAFTNFSDLTNTNSADCRQDLINEFVVQLSHLPDCVLLVGGSNDTSMNQPAIRRGRWFTQSFPISLPDANTLSEVLNCYTRATIEFETLMGIAQELVGWEADDIEKLVITARAKARTESRDLLPSDLLKYIRLRSSLIPKDEFRVTVHKAGKAIISSTLGYTSVATKITNPNIIPSLKSQSTAGAAPTYLSRLFPDEASPNNDIAVLISGAIAENLIFGDCSTSSSGCFGSDIERASKIALRLADMNRASISEPNSQKIESTSCNTSNFDERTRAAFTILQSQYQRVLGMLEAKRDRLIMIAEDLVFIQNSTVDHDSYFGTTSI